jgi:hypothetical protein
MLQSQSGSLNEFSGHTTLACRLAEAACLSEGILIPVFQEFNSLGACARVAEPNTSPYAKVKRRKLYIDFFMVIR